MKQINKSNITITKDGTTAHWCIFCDHNDLCYTCDASDWGNKDCGTCDKEYEYPKP
ncbi:hypothetical protein [Oceanirhabdus sp. W0125-5]|uniref:hypothetical protein n=1 Tax=Oceanirhabdus sp. W0125-5 TaxID=2999116 RepID=UPI0022F2B021|nr:hypothetical protein [Oceanirhabdus sp. W0125-5]WBW97749.1 hypothetical protein OW730_02920 [Oceanirhabdus sp. W0125-5]